MNKNSNFYKAIEKAIIESGSEEMKILEDSGHEFSNEYQSKIDEAERIANSKNRSGIPVIKIRFKAASIIAAALILTGSLILAESSIFRWKPGNWFNDDEKNISESNMSKTENKNLPVTSVSGDEYQTTYTEANISDNNGDRDNSVSLNKPDENVETKTTIAVEENDDTIHIEIDSDKREPVNKPDNSKPIVTSPPTNTPIVTKAPVNENQTPSYTEVTKKHDSIIVTVPDVTPNENNEPEPPQPTDHPLNNFDHSQTQVQITKISTTASVTEYNADNIQKIPAKTDGKSNTYATTIKNNN